MPGAGTYPAGLGPGGVGLSSDSAARVPVRRVVAVLWDPSQKQLVQEDDGQLASVHPVDQRVILRLGIQKKSIPSVTSQGQSILESTPAIEDGRTQAAIRDEVYTALADLIAARDIEIISVTTVLDESEGGTATEVSYFNTRTKRDKTIRLGVT